MPKDSNPTVSVIMPVYNTEKYLREALDSVMYQSFKDFELICVDDNSSDNSYQILKEYKAKYPNKIRLFENKRNMGVGFSANYAISKARGVLVARMDSDDIMYSTRLEKEAKFLLEHPEVIMVGGQVVLIDEDGRRLGHKKFPLDHEHLYEMLFSVMPIQQGASMVNRALLPKDFKFYLGNSRVAEEVELYFKLLQYGDFANIKSNVLKYRQYISSTSLSDTKKTFYETFKTRMKALKKYKYKPTLKGWIINLLQYLTISLLPERWIYPLFMFLRGIKPKKNLFKLSDFRLLLQTKIDYPFKEK